jgi:2-amino-4-hydroxy-6-hydroxymethyldihydropteridine diphosphokinase/dihydropteroate synthase
MVILGFGTNQGDRTKNLRTALYHLGLIDQIKIIQVSPLYKSNALLLENTPKDWDQFYLNVAVSCKTTLEPLELLKILKNIEINMGRNQCNLRWAPRIIDIDILAWRDKKITTAELTIPHPELHNRPFALWPFMDLILEWQAYIAEQNTINAILENLKQWGSRLTNTNTAPLNTHKLAHRIDIPKLLGILNVTPDSFSDGGKNQSTEKALEHAIHLFNSGADFIDIGAESTRPNAEEISAKLEWERLYPILQAIVNYWQNNSWKPKISIDTRHYQVAENAISLGVDWINDVSGLTDPKMCRVIREADVHAVYMHNLGIPANRDNLIPSEKDPIQEIFNWASDRKIQILQTGINPDKLVFDPGIGFGKNAIQTLQLLHGIHEFNALNLPLLVGHSRKSFLNICTNYPATNRDHETAVVSEFLARKKIQYLRIHNVEHNMRNLQMQTFLL